MEKVLFIIFAAIAVASAVNIVLQRSPLYSALSLIGTLASLSALYVTVRAQFIAAMQIVVYAGAIMVLFVFVIMLLNVPKDQPHVEKQKWLRYLAAPFAGVLLGEAFFVLRTVKLVTLPAAVPASDPELVVGTTANVGRALFTSYLLPFEVTSVLIMMAVVGAIVLGRREEKTEKEA
ncbi:MAG TPA: NADH-quinone oxidoreductase subunit J [Blastocatellia bacterium]|nr:NADH-quinone oxidoreductase subunit J [Blastocatellia bacterium]